MFIVIDHHDVVFTFFFFLRQSEMSEVKKRLQFYLLRGLAVRDDDIITLVEEVVAYLAKFPEIATIPCD